MGLQGWFRNFDGRHLAASCRLSHRTVWEIYQWLSSRQGVKLHTTRLESFRQPEWGLSLFRIRLHVEPERNHRRPR